MIPFFKNLTWNRAPKSCSLGSTLSNLSLFPQLHAREGKVMPGIVIVTYLGSILKGRTGSYAVIGNVYFTGTTLRWAAKYGTHWRCATTLQIQRYTVRNSKERAGKRSKTFVNEMDRWSVSVSCTDRRGPYFLPKPPKPPFEARVGGQNGSISIPSN